MPQRFKKNEKLEIIGYATRAHAGELPWFDKGICESGYVHPFDRWTAREVCLFFDISRSCLGQWVTQGCPKNNGQQTYNAIDLMQWRRDRDQRNEKKSGRASVDMEEIEIEYTAILKEAGVNGLDDATDKFLTMGNSFYQELLRKRMAEISMIKRDLARGNLISSEEVYDSGVEIGNRLRALFELMERHFGRKVADFLRTGLEDIEKVFKKKKPGKDK